MILLSNAGEVRSTHTTSTAFISVCMVCIMYAFMSIIPRPLLHSPFILMQWHHSFNPHIQIECPLNPSNTERLGPCKKVSSREVTRTVQVTRTVTASPVHWSVPAHSRCSVDVYWVSEGHEYLSTCNEYIIYMVRRCVSLQCVYHYCCSYRVTGHMIYLLVCFCCIHLTIWIFSYPNFSPNCFMLQVSKERE